MMMLADFTHPLEREYFQKLNANKAFKIIMGAFGKIYANVNNFAAIPDRCLIVRENIFPRLFNLYKIAKDRLEISNDCELFCNMDYGRNAKVIGTNDNCAIVIDSSCIEDFSNEQLIALLGRELGHVKMGHVTYITVLDFIDELGIFIPKIVKDSVKGLLIEWLLTAQYSADRAGAIAAGNIKAMIQTHLMASGFETIEQCNGYEFNSEMTMPQSLIGFDRAAKIIMTETLRNFPIPFVIPRINTLIEWSKSAECKKDFSALFNAGKTFKSINKTPTVDACIKNIDNEGDDKMFDSNKALNLSRGQRADLTKNNLKLKKLAIGVRWSNTNIRSTVDHCAFLLNRDGKVHSDDDFVYYNNPIHKSESIEYVPSTKNTAWFNVNIDKIPADVDKIDFNLTIYNSGMYRATFGKLESIVMLVVDVETNKELLRFDLSKLFFMETAIVVGEMYRHKGEWKFKAVGEGFNGGVEALCQNAGISFSFDDD